MLVVVSSMAKTNVVSINQERQFAFPPEILATLGPGDEYLLWQTDDTLVLKKITQPISFDTLFERIEALGPDPDQPTEAEICEIVKTLRHDRAHAYDESVAVLPQPLSAKDL